VFGDWVSGRLFNLDPNTQQIQEITIDSTGAPGGKYIGFGETPAGELLVMTADFAASPPSRLVEVVSGAAPGLDSDGDGIDDDFDNCRFTPNGPLIPDPEGGASQQDDDGDGIGNACDLLIPAQFIPAARVGSAYSHPLTILRGQPLYTCNLVNGFLPADLSLGSDCVISGNVTAGGFTATFTAQVTDDSGDTATRMLKIRSKIPNCTSCHAAALPR
jgi:hypothetical protein